MWPWGHLAFGYLAYSVLIHVVARRRPSDAATVALAVGTQFPDLVDKPLALRFGVIPNGRSLAHSLLTAVLVTVVLRLVLRRWNRGSMANAFGVGYLAHLAGDALYPVLSADYYSLRFLAWPLVPPVEYSTEPNALALLESLTTVPSLAPSLTFETGLALAVFLLWLVDGAPGPRAVAAIPRWLGRKLSAQ